MSESVQQIDDSVYERPNQPYRCGHSRESVSCPLGPSRLGICQGGYACRPLKKGEDEGNRVICGRTPLQGGKCEKGPTAEGLCCIEFSTCSPIPSIRRQRQQFTFLCFSALVGLILLTMSSDWRNKVLKPGPLTQQHAQLLSNTSNQLRCAACHGAAEEGLANWTADWTLSALHPHETNSSQPDRCLKCHDQRIAPDVALVAHNTPVARLEAMSQAYCERHDIAPRETEIAKSSQSHLACNACHREHHGSDHDLTAMTNLQCGGCHQSEFERLTHHPEFGAWPYERRTRIAFDHNSHLARHFPSQQKEFTCRSCHVSNQAGEIVSVTGYAACASCHDEKIKRSFGDGIPLVLLPMIDTAALTKEGIDVGEWPSNATGDFDGGMPLLARVLLSTDVYARAAMEQFENDFDFADVDAENVDDLEAAADLVWGIKSLIYDLVKGGNAALQTRIEAATDMELDSDQLQKMSGRLSHETMRQLQMTWFPNLMQEVPAFRAGNPIPPAVKERIQSETPTVTHGWCRDDEVFGLSYRPLGHASRFVETWLSTLTKSERSTYSGDVRMLLAAFTSRSSHGMCTSCHSADEQPDNWPPVIQWAAKRSERDQHRFTRFSHDPHLIVPRLKDCSSCHQLDSTADSMETYSRGDPTEFESNFLPLERETCADCHTPLAAGDQCTTCHLYHVDTW